MRRPRGTAPAVPCFTLYGEPAAPPLATDEMLHVETVPVRSRHRGGAIDPHVHRELLQLIWLARGSAEVALDEWQGSCTAPSAIVVPPGTVHAFRFADDADGCVITLGVRALADGESPAVASALRQLFEKARTLPLHADDAGTRRLQSLVDALLVEAGSPDVAAAPAPRWLVRAIVWRLAQAAAQPMRGGQAPARRHLFARFLELVEAHHLEHWPVARYASALGLSPERLNRLVRAEAGHSALALIHQRLVREACRRLVYVAAPVAQLADELGFADAGYFCRFFKRHTGCTPGAYRARHGAAG